MGLFSSSKGKKDELQKAKASLKSLDKRKSHKMATSTIDPTKALSEMQPCTDILRFPRERNC